MRALLGREIGVARGEREAVGIADGGRADDLERKIEVAHHLPDDAELLIVLLAEHGDVGRDLHEQLAHTVATPPKEVRTRVALKARRGALRDDARGKAVRVHRPRSGIQAAYADRRRRELGEVARLVAWVALEVLVRGELGRVDEDRDDDTPARWRPSRTSARWPSCRAPMVGTRAMVSPDSTPRRHLCPQLAQGAYRADAVGHDLAGPGFAIVQCAPRDSTDPAGCGQGDPDMGGRLPFC